jgi:hypothetical protein
MDFGIETILPIHFLIWFLSLVGLALMFVLWATEKQKRGYIYAPWLWLFNAFMFSTAWYTGMLSPQALVLWSGIVRLHGMILMFILVWLQVKGIKC